jgi:hypothetical protein
MKNRATVNIALREALGDLKMALKTLGEVEGRFVRNGERGLYEITGLRRETEAAMTAAIAANNRILLLLEGQDEE